MDVKDVSEIIDGLSIAGVTVWVDGGWCVDALVGRELRVHGDLDIAVRRADESHLCNWLTAHRFERRLSPNDSDWNYVLHDAQARAIDVHVFEFDAHGNHVYGIEYPVDSLTGRATLGGLAIHCIAPEWMFRFKTAYDPAPKDLIDVQALADKYGYEVPESHLARVRGERKGT